MTRWCSARWCATTPISTIRWASSREASASTSSPAPTRTSTARASSRWLAYAYSPEKVVAWIRRDEGSERYYADQFQHVFGMPLEQAWQDWIAFEHEFQRQNLAEVRKFPITPHRNLAASAVGSVSRTYFDEATGILYGGFRYPGVVEYVGALNTRDGSVRQLADIKRAMLYKVTSLAYDPSQRNRSSYTNDNLVASGPDGGRREDRRRANAVRERARSARSSSIRSTVR